VQAWRAEDKQSLENHSIEERQAMADSKNYRHDGSSSESDDTLVNEYQKMLYNKLIALIGVVRAARWKVRNLLEQGSGDKDKLVVIHGNLTNTLNICLRAQAVMVRKLAVEQGALPDEAKRMECDGKRQSGMTYREYVEFVSMEEYSRFKDLPPVRENEIRQCDLNDLIDKLMAE